ncbi:maleylacetate reductase [Pseudonocardia sp. TRM90224]|uniref:maleylacetate reductase n=1 Tax=Pseudonocardia sp. TRM90224 TaxID=2812678 RepID=UPI001E4AB601|nr:maleylacetate reductase [Pseudonocardia sp. TRM90224]
MHAFTYDALPARIVFGPGTARTRLASEVVRLGAGALLVVASDRDAERVGELVEPLAERVAGTFTAVREHVPIATAQAARAAAAEVGADALLCIGGGSTIGAAKAVALTARIPIIAVPTTYSGSEVTAVWGLTEDGRKSTGTDLAVLPKVVVYDPDLTATLPTGLAVASGLNAMAHGVEAMWAPGRNPVSSVLAEDGVRDLTAGLRGSEPASLLRGAWLTASAFAVTGGGLHHKLCHVLGGTFDLPHAQTHAVVLPHVLAFNAPGAPEAGTRLARAFGVDDPVRALRELADELGVPHGLRELGLREDQIAEAAALTEPAVPKDNPVPVGGGAMERLVRAAWAGGDDG